MAENIWENTEVVNGIKKMISKLKEEVKWEPNFFKRQTIVEIEKWKIALKELENKYSNIDIKKLKEIKEKIEKALKEMSSRKRQILILDVEKIINSNWKVNNDFLGSLSVAPVLIKTQPKPTKDEEWEETEKAPIKEEKEHLDKPKDSEEIVETRVTWDPILDFPDKYLKDWDILLIWDISTKLEKAKNMSDSELESEIKSIKLEWTFEPDEWKKLFEDLEKTALGNENIEEKDKKDFKKKKSRFLKSELANTKLDLDNINKSIDEQLENLEKQNTYKVKIDMYPAGEKSVWWLLDYLWGKIWITPWKEINFDSKHNALIYLYKVKLVLNTNSNISWYLMRKINIADPRPMWLR